MKSKIAFMFIVIAASLAQASGFFTLKGKLKGFTEKTIIVATEKMDYEISKDGLNPAMKAEVAKMKTGQKLEFNISTEYIIRATAHAKM